LESYLSEEVAAVTERTTRFIHVGNYAAEVEVDLIVDDTGWSPYLSHQDALKLDRVRRALKTDNLAAAMRDARVYELTELAAE
jgi:hypothetical protein